MPSNEADRIAHQKVMQRERQAEEELRNQNEQLIARLQQCVEDIEAETPIVLRLLAERDYPGVEEVHTRFYYHKHKPNLIERLLGAESDGVKAGWKIGKFTYTIDGETRTAAIYFLSDGRITFGGSEVIETPRNWLNTRIGNSHKVERSYSYSEVLRSCDEILTSTLKGLQGLRRELEAGGAQ